MGLWTADSIRYIHMTGEFGVFNRITLVCKTEGDSHRVALVSYMRLCWVPQEDPVLPRSASG